MGFPNIKETIFNHRDRPSLATKTEGMRRILYKSEVVEDLSVEITHQLIDHPPYKTYAVITSLVAIVLASGVKISKSIPPLLLIASSAVMAFATVYFLAKSAWSVSSLQQSLDREQQINKLRMGIADPFLEIIKNAELKKVLLPVELQAIYRTYYEQTCRVFLRQPSDVKTRKQLNEFIKAGAFKEDVLKLVYPEGQVPQAVSALASLCEAYSEFEKKLALRLEDLTLIHAKNMRELTQGKDDRLIAEIEHYRQFFAIKIECASDPIIMDYYTCAKALAEAVLRDQSAPVKASALPTDLPTLEQMLPNPGEDGRYGKLYRYTHPVNMDPYRKG
jgi:hypothetical protein